MTTAARRPAEFLKTLGAADVAFMAIIAVVSLRWIPRAARAGWLSVSLWCLAGTLFFIPLTLIVVELSTRFPEQGGLYVWTRRAFGARHAFFCGWCLWLNQVFYFPSYLLFAVANLAALGGPHTTVLARNQIVSAAVVLALLWGLTALNILGFEVAKWLQSAGTLGLWIPAGLLLAAVVIALSKTGAATPFTARDLLPHGDTFSALGLWSSMCFAFSGFEIAGLVGQEIKTPRRTVPIGLALAGVATVLLYIGGSTAILLATPAGQISERTGIGDAIQAATGSPVTGSLVLALMAVAAIATTSSWIAGAARVPYAAAVAGRLPAFLGKVHPRFRTPHIALLVQAVFASMTLLASLFLNVEHQTTTVEEAYDVLVNLTILIYFVPYLYLFLSPLRLPQDSLQGDVPGIPGGKPGRFTVCTAGAATTLVAIVLLFIPPPGTRSVWNFETNLVLQSGVIFAAGFLLDRFRNKP